MDRDSDGAAEKTEPTSPLRGISGGGSSAAGSLASRPGTCGATDVARARWTLLRQVLRQTQMDSPEVKQASVRRFATFNLFSRKRLVTQDSSYTSDDQWVEYRSVFFPEYSALLRDNLGPLRVNEVLNSFDNTGNVCCFLFHPLSSSSQTSCIRFKSSDCAALGSLCCCTLLLCHVFAFPLSLLLCRAAPRMDLLWSVAKASRPTRQTGWRPVNESRIATVAVCAAQPGCY
ncbi:putative calmodulin-lysine N-methyltransferase-like, partial [Scophthalmus maximus]